jgi:hypothetical protein
MIMTITMFVISVEMMKIGVNMFRKLKIITLALLAIVSWMVLYMATIKYLLGI